VSDTQLAALLSRVATWREKAAEELRRSAEAQVSTLLQATRLESRSLVREAVVQARRRVDLARRQHHAELALLQRRAANDAVARQIEVLWADLPGLLSARWGEPLERRRWIGAAVRIASSLLPGRDWCIVHGPDAAHEEIEDCLREARALHPEAVPRSVELCLDPAAGAGVRIQAGSATVDATIDGVLADRADIEALFLAELAAQAPA
jgi:hypothetical protein